MLLMWWVADFFLDSWIFRFPILMLGLILGRSVVRIPSRIYKLRWSKTTIDGGTPVIWGVVLGRFRRPPRWNLMRRCKIAPAFVSFSSLLWESISTFVLIVFISFLFSYKIFLEQSIEHSVGVFVFFLFGSWGFSIGDTCLYHKAFYVEGLAYRGFRVRMWVRRIWETGKFFGGKEGVSGFYFLFWFIFVWIEFV